MGNISDEHLLHYYGASSALGVPSGHQVIHTDPPPDVESIGQFFSSIIINQSLFINSRVPIYSKIVITHIVARKSQFRSPQ